MDTRARTNGSICGGAVLWLIALACVLTACGSSRRSGLDAGPLVTQDAAATSTAGNGGGPVTNPICAGEGAPCSGQACCDPLVCQTVCTSTPVCAANGQSCDRVDCCEGFTCMESICRL